MKRKPIGWIVKRRIDNRMLCCDGMWRRNVAGAENWKLYKTDWRAIKFGLKYEDGTAYAIHEGDTLTRDGSIERANGYVLNANAGE